MEGSTMTKVLIDIALVAIAVLAGKSIMDSGRKFAVLFRQLRADMAAGTPMQAMQVTTMATGAATALGPVPAMVYRPGTNVANNPAGALPVKVRTPRRPAALRAAA
jgi:hypothetical protein